jgi:solute carrier family 45 protein 1/2/4
MILLPWTSEIASVLTPDFSSEPHNKSKITVQSFLAGLLVWALNISIQPMQVGIRALVVDSCPPQQQVQATSYVSGITAVGSILGYTFGFINLPRLFPWLGNTPMCFLTHFLGFNDNSSNNLLCYTREVPNIKKWRGG